MNDTGIKIDKNVPVPRRGTPKYPLAELKVGESFFVAQDEETSIETIRQSALFHGRTHHKKFITRKVEEEGKIGCRVWRMEDPKSK